MQRKKVIVSACLIGHTCRYDGKTKKSLEILNSLKDYDIVPFCPEAPLFGTPRERISVLHVENKHRIFTDDTKKDVTELLRVEIESFILKNSTVDKIILKSKSPSCGVGTTPVLNSNLEFKYFGNGIAGDIFLENYKETKIEDETNYTS